MFIILRANVFKAKITTVYNTHFVKYVYKNM